MQARAEAFVSQLAQALPRLAAIRYDSGRGENWEAPKTSNREAIRQRLHTLGSPLLSERLRKDWPQNPRYRETLLPPLSWLDSLRALWPEDDGVLEADVLLNSRNELRIFSPVLLQLAMQGIALSAIQQFATAALETAQHAAVRTEVGDALSVLGYWLTGTVALAQGDTTRALPALLEAARAQKQSDYDAPSGAGLPAARLLANLAEVRRDTAQWMLALTLQRLQRAPSWQDAESMVVDARLRELYEGYVVTRHMPVRDVVPHRLDGEGKAALRAPMAFESYLDRQWTILYDRDFSIERGPVAPSGGATPHRLVVMEYLTGVGCGGCWKEDRVASAVLRRYRSDRVMVLATHFTRPVSDFRYDPDERFWGWYPNSYVKGTSRIPIRTLLTAAGDTLSSEFFVDGRGTPRRGPAEAKSFPGVYGQYQQLTHQIDAAVLRRPDALVGVNAERHGDHVLVHVQIDSLQESHHALALRLALVEDTVWVRSGSIRRIYQNVVRAEAHADSLPMGLPLAMQRHAIIRYRFDVAAIQRGILARREDPDAIARRYSLDHTQAVEWRDDIIARFPDRRDWQLDPARLSVVAFVQDLETGEVLQAACVKIP